MDLRLLCRLLLHSLILIRGQMLNQCIVGMGGITATSNVSSLRLRLPLRTSSKDAICRVVDLMTSLLLRKNLLFAHGFYISARVQHSLHLVMTSNQIQEIEEQGPQAVLGRDRTALP